MEFKVGDRVVSKAYKKMFILIDNHDFNYPLRVEDGLFYETYTADGKIYDININIDLRLATPLDEVL